MRAGARRKGEAYRRRSMGRKWPRTPGYEAGAKVVCLLTGQVNQLT